MGKSNNSNISSTSTESAKSAKAIHKEDSVEIPADHQPDGINKVYEREPKRARMKRGFTDMLPGPERTNAIFQAMFAKMEVV